MKLIVVKRFLKTGVSEVKVVVFCGQREWENMYVVSSPKYFNKRWASSIPVSRKASSQGGHRSFIPGPPRHDPVLNVENRIILISVIGKTSCLQSAVVLRIRKICRAEHKYDSSKRACVGSLPTPQIG